MNKLIEIREEEVEESKETPKEEENAETSEEEGKEEEGAEE